MNRKIRKKNVVQRLVLLIFIKYSLITTLSQWQTNYIFKLSTNADTSFQQYQSVHTAHRNSHELHIIA